MRRESTPISRRLTARVAIAGWLSLAATAAGQHGSSFIVVSPIPSDPVASCTALNNALSSIVAPNSSNRFAVKLEPGRYDCTGQTIHMRPYVDITGSGKESTLIEGLGDTTHSIDGVTAKVLIKGTNHAELSNLSVVVNEPGENVIAILNDGTAPRITGVEISVTGEEKAVGAHCWGILNYSEPPMGCVDNASNNTSAQPVIRQTQINVLRCHDLAVAIDNWGNINPEIRRSYVMGANSPTANIGIRYRLKCVRKQQRKFLRDVEASAYGVGGEDSASCYGVAFIDTVLDLVDFVDVSIHAKNCGDVVDPSLDVCNDFLDQHDGKNIGLRTSAFRFTLWNSQIEAKGGNSVLAAGLDVNDDGVALIHNSTIRGNTCSIRAVDGSAANAGATHLFGSVFEEPGSTIKCAGVYNKSFAFLPSTCP